jgi:D-alanyl-D-alanine carboxypeptidase
MSDGSVRDHRRARPSGSPTSTPPGRPPRAGRSWAALVIAAVGLIAIGFVGGTGVARALVPVDAASPFDGPLASCRIGDRLTPHRAPSDWARTLLDQEYALADDDAPTDLVPLAAHGIDGDGSVRSLVIDDLAAMTRDARDAGSPFRVTSAFRSYEQQVRTFSSLEDALGRDEALRSAARPGHSEHQLGTTIDIDGGEGWLATNAWRYGFVMSYPPEHSPETTCYKPEPWHFRYVGQDAARAVLDSGLSLRAWLWERQSGR